MVRDVAAGAPTFGDLLRRHRRDRGLTQEMLAERAGVSVRAISDLERGARTHPYRETANLLAEALALAGSEQQAFIAAAGRVVRVAARSTSGAPVSRLPVPLSRLISREEELAALRRILGDDRGRLVTLTGPGGVGKTRLALAVAAELADRFPDGVVFIDLAPLWDSDQVEPAIAAAVGLRDHGNIPLAEALQRTLGTRQMLLVLDNFEHLLAAAPIVAAILAAAPQVQVLVTSRAVLRLRGERAYALSPLPLPELAATMRPEALADWAAIQLFVERAGEAQPDFRLTAENASAVAAICHRLDGLPLAIELAAARTRLLEPADLLARLELRLPLLTSGARDAPLRQRTLQDAIAWSYDLLDPHEQTLLRALAVFAGGWTLAAVETVGELCGVADPLAAFTTLHEQSLVVRDDRAAGPRYRLLETIREFAAARLAAAGDEVLARHAHLHYLLQLARDNDLERLDAGLGTRLARLQAEEANLRAGIEWALDHDPESTLAVLAELGFFWFHNDQQVVGADLLARALATGAGAYGVERARVLQQAAWLATWGSDPERAEPLADAALALAETANDRRTMAHVRMCMADVAMHRGDLARARIEFVAALAMFEAAGDLWGTCICSTLFGQAAQRWDDPTLAVSCFERIEAITVAYGLPSRYHAHYLENLANVYHQLGRHGEAMAASIAAVQHALESGSRTHLTYAQQTLARLLLDGDEPEQALALGAEIGSSLVVQWEIGDKWNLVSALQLAAALMAAGDRATPAARTLGAADALRDEVPYPVSAFEQSWLAARRAEVVAALGEEAFTRALAVGRARPLAAAIAEAQTALTALGTGAGVVAGRDSGGLDTS